MRVDCQCRPFSNRHGTLGILGLPNLWICGICYRVPRWQVLHAARHCSECLRRYSYPNPTRVCRECDENPKPRNDWGWYCKAYEKLSSVPSDKWLETYESLRKESRAIQDGGH